MITNITPTPKINPESLEKIQAFMKDALVSDVMAHKRRVLGFRTLIKVNQDEPIINVLKIMKENDIVSIPVFSSQRRFLFLCTVEMILEWMIFQEAFKAGQDKKSLSAAKLGGDWMKSFRDFVSTADKEFTMKIPVRDVLNVYLAQAKATQIVLPSDSVARLLSLFLSSSERMHRVLVVEPGSGKDVTLDENHPSQIILSASDLLSFLEEESKKPRSHDLKAVFGLNITDANLLFDRYQHRAAEQTFNPTLVTCSVNMHVMDVFRKLFMEDVTAMPIVDSRDKLCGTISTSDLVGVAKENLEILDGSLAVFMERVKASHSHLKKNSIGSCTMDANVATAMRRMLKHKIHRVWIMNDESMPLGAVTVSDILTLFWSENLRVEA